MRLRDCGNLRNRQVLIDARLEEVFHNRGADAGFAEAVVAGALVGVAEHLVGLRDLLEPLLGRGVAGVGVGVQLAGARR